MMILWKLQDGKRFEKTVLGRREAVLRFFFALSSNFIVSCDNETVFVWSRRRGKSVYMLPVVIGRNRWIMALGVGDGANLESIALVFARVFLAANDV